MSVTFDNSLFTAAQSSAGIYALGNFTGTSLLSGPAPVTINGTVDNPGSTVQVNLDLGGVTTTGANGTYLGYSAIANSQDYVYYFNVTAADLQTPVTVAVTSEAALPALSLQAVNVSNVSAPVSQTPVCFAAGSRILTVDGYRAVELLMVGDLVQTASGTLRAVRWLGHRLVDCSRAFEPASVLPIRIRAEAFGPNRPERDLLLSPGHRLFVNHRLVHAEQLLNGWSILRDHVDEIDYWHVELDSHDILIAEGLPAESYIDAGNRHAFEPDGSVVLGSVDLDGTPRADDCYAPMIGEGPELTAIKAALLDRARLFGARYVEDSGIQLVADGAPLTPIRVEGDRFTFHVPHPTRLLRVMSRSAMASEVQSFCDDRRELGVMLSGLVVDGETHDMTGPIFSAGWHGLERRNGETARWTKGDGALPIGREISFRMMALPRYHADKPESDETTGSTRTRTRLRAVA